ncbi:MAG TPA: PilC/PilY family type IV pilus protein, partial [Candidatus Berkiella sp.]|nr:PilC/PilY family type IV pilus protein [Candidatus Berkiella sp.]
NGGSYAFKDRTRILGDIVDSAPIYVGPPSRTYPDSLETAPYSTFVSSYQSRLPLVYVGANDGMLHAFSGNDGTEKMAYITGSSQIFQNLPSLSVSPYTH